jgi:type II secretory pathway pseudopilin PulG
MKKKGVLGGFTVLEMIIVMGIMLTMVSLVLANYPSFNERLGVRQAAEEIASSGRQVQAYGLGVKEFGKGSGAFPGYGLHFSRFASADVPATSYIFFADNNKDLQYNAPGEKISDAPIQGSAYISDICANQKQIPAGPCGLLSLDVVYLRPTPSVSLKSGGFLYADVEVKIKGSRGTTKTIIFWLSGQVSIE